MPSGMIEESDDYIESLGGFGFLNVVFGWSLGTQDLQKYEEAP